MISITIDGDLEQYREPLLQDGKAWLQGQIVSKVDVEGLVQQTFLEAYQQVTNLRSEHPLARAAWIRRVFHNNLVDELRRFRRQSRDVSREQSIHETPRNAVGNMNLPLADSQPSPCDVAIQRENVTHLRAALSRLPQLQRQAVELHHLGGLTLVEVAKRGVLRGASL